MPTTDAAPGRPQTTVTDSAERALQQVTQAATQRHDRPGQDQQQLHEAIRRALAAGAPPADIARAAGLSRTRIYAIGQAPATTDTLDGARRAAQLRSMPRTQLRRLCTPEIASAYAEQTGTPRTNPDHWRKDELIAAILNHERRQTSS